MLDESAKCPFILNLEGQSIRRAMASNPTAGTAVLKTSACKRRLNFSTKSVKSGGRGNDSLTDLFEQAFHFSLNRAREFFTRSKFE